MNLIETEDLSKRLFRTESPPLVRIKKGGADLNFIKIAYKYTKFNLTYTIY